MVVQLHVLAMLLVGWAWSALGRVDNTAHDYLCSEDSTYTRNLPWHCSSYVVCDGGHAYVFNCPVGTVFDRHSQLCDWPHKVGINSCARNPLGSFDHICKWHPRMKLASHSNCAQYYDCAQTQATREYVQYIMECPYPQLFSEQYGGCVHFKSVNCGKRPIPVAPCDYAQYKQLCHDRRRCPPCHKRHPSCYGRRDGLNAIPSITNYFMYCDLGRTIDIKKCPDMRVFAPQTGRCVPLTG